jgi:hypothetical protein
MNRVRHDIPKKRKSIAPGVVLALLGSCVFALSFVLYIDWTNDQHILPELLAYGQSIMFVLIFSGFAIISAGASLALSAKKYNSELGTGEEIAWNSKNIRKKHLLPDENVLFETRPHLSLLHIVYFVKIGGGLIVAMVLLEWLPDSHYYESVMAAIGISEQDNLVSAIFWIAAFLIGFLAVFLQLDRWSSRLYAATDERILEWTKYPYKPPRYIPVAHIRSISVTQPWWGRRRDYGTLVFLTESLMDGRTKNGHGMKWVAVPRPQAAKTTIEEIVRTKRSTREVGRDLRSSSLV